MTYAAQTTVSVDRSKAEVHRLLRRYGATRIADAWEPTSAAVQFEIKGVVARLSIPIPTEAEIKARPRARKSPAAVKKAATQIERQRWRMLALLLKAKLEAVELGLTTMEEEFLASIVLRNGETIGQHVLGAIEGADPEFKLLPAKGDT